MAKRPAEKPIINAEERERVERDAAEFTDPTTRDALPAEALVPLLTEQLQRSIATNQELVRQARETAEVSSLLNCFAGALAERWASALGAGGFLTTYQVQKRAEEEIERMAAKVRAVRERHRGSQMSRENAAPPGVPVAFNRVTGY